MIKVLALAVAVLGGCSLYADDDDPSGVDGGIDASPSIDGTWRVEWECATTCNANPLERNTEINVSSDASGIRVAWPASHIEHVGEWDGFCLRVPNGEDDEIARAPYSVCVGYSERIMSGSVTWAGGGQWRLTVQR